MSSKEVSAEDFGPMTAIEVRAESFKKLKLFNVHPKREGLALVRGKNGAGKSTALDVVESALRGGSHKVEMPIAVGKHKSETVVDLGELIIEKEYKKDSGGQAKATLIVRDKDRNRIRKAQTLLNELVGTFVDPIAFEGMSPADQVKTVLRVIGLDEELNRLERIEEGALEDRRDAKRDADKSLKAFEAIRNEMPTLSSEAPPMTLEEAITAHDIAKDLNQEIRDAKMGRDAAETRGRAIVARIDDLKESIDKIKIQIEGFKSEAQVERDLYEGFAVRLEELKPADEEKALEDVRVAQQWNKQASNLDMLNQAEKRMGDDAAQVTVEEERVQKVRNEIANLLAAAEFPVEGMSYDNLKKTLLMNGVPYSEASQAERIRVGCAVAMSGDPKIRILFVREGSLLDDDSREIVESMAIERGFQVLFEVVDSNPEGAGIYIENGEVVSESDE